MLAIRNFSGIYTFYGYDYTFYEYSSQQFFLKIALKEFGNWDGESA